jgi:aminocarboxymuconate-semialdehyde decarboxylase
VGHNPRLPSVVASRCFDGGCGAHSTASPGHRAHHVMPAIDVHVHIVPPLFVDVVRRGDLREAMETAAHPSGEPGVDRLVFHPPPGVPVEPDTALRPAVYDPHLILAALDRRKLDAAAISPPPELFVYWTRPELGEQIARAMNDGMAELARVYPDRFLPLATLPLQAGARAADELDRAIRHLGLRGAAICTNVNGRDLDASEFRPVFEAAARLDVPLFLHPQNAGDISRIQDYHLWNLLGFPTESAVAASRMIMSGMLEALPGLKVILAHGGGFFPYQVGRMDHGYHVRSDLQDRLPRPPSFYLGQIYADSLIHDGRSLRFLIDRLGFEHVVLGCDYPFDMGCERPVDAVRALALPSDQERAILGATLGRLLKVG